MELKLNNLLNYNLWLTLHMPYSYNWKNSVHRQDIPTYYGNNPIEINVFLSHQPICEFGIKRIPKCTSFMNLPPIDEIFLVPNYKFLDGLHMDILWPSVKVWPPIGVVY
jgi:hypothetical protein